MTVADAPPPPLPVPGMPPPMLADGEVVARAWIAALVAVTPLDEVPALPVPALAREAPPLCAALVRALGSDDELALLPLMGAGAGALAGGRDAASTASALSRLRDVVLEAVLAQADRPDGAWVARVALRVGHACDRLLEAALAAGPESPPARGDRRAGPPRGARPARSPAAPREPTPPLPSDDELAAFMAERGLEDDDDADDADARGEDAADAGEEQGARRGRGPLPDPLAALDPSRLVVRDGAPPWERMIARAVGRHFEDGVPFAVLAVEADGAERLLAADGGGQALERADRALGESVRARDRVVSDPPARWWALVPDAGVEEAKALARRIAGAVGAIQHGGAPLRVSIGIASCPRDGTDAESLAATADERLLGARAAGEAVDGG